MSIEIYDEWQFEPLLEKHGVHNKTLVNDLNEKMDKFARQYMTNADGHRKAAYREILCFALQLSIDEKKSIGAKKPLDVLIDELEKNG
ncbi:TPA: hypothetical protein KDX54_000081 [Vibrio vulnificus]|nr:hypothetical protein [Vibrio vulnificus]